MKAQLISDKTDKPLLADNVLKFFSALKRVGNRFLDKEVAASFCSFDGDRNVEVVRIADECSHWFFRKRVIKVGIGANLVKTLEVFCGINVQLWCDDLVEASGAVSN